MGNEGSTDWHSDQDVQTAVRNFHDKYAKQPTEKMHEAMNYHEKVTNQIRNYLQEKGICHHLEYTGSSYEGVKVDTDLEFDVMVVMKCPGLTAERARQDDPTRYTLTLRNREAVHPIAKIVNNQWFSSELHPAEALDKFYGEILKALTALGLSDHIKVRRHWSAVQLDVYRPCSGGFWSYMSQLFSGSGGVWYNVDMCPVFEIDGSLFVATTERSYDAKWRLTFSPTEKNILRTIDHDNGCRRECLRVLKVLRSRDTTLQSMRTNYPLKLALLNSNRIHYDWDRRQIGQCVLRLLTYLRDVMERDGTLENPNFPGVNIIANMDQIVRDNVRGRLNTLVTKKHKFLDIMT